MVLASGSGLDPHITLRNARYQSDRVAAARAGKTGIAVARIRPIVDELLQQLAFHPLAGLAGGDGLVNVLELNLALDARMRTLQAR